MKVVGFGVLALLMGVLLGCGGARPTATTSEVPAGAQVTAVVGSLRIEGAYVRPTVNIAAAAQTTMAGTDHSGHDMNHDMGQGTTGSSAAYFVVVNGGAEEDTLLAASMEGASSVGLHETIIENNIARMVPRPEGLPIPANGTLRLRPGGPHVMVEGLQQPLTEGLQVELTLRFARAGTLKMQVPVRQGS